MFGGYIKQENTFFMHYSFYTFEDIPEIIHGKLIIHRIMHAEYKIKISPEAEISHIGAYDSEAPERPGSGDSQHIKRPVYTENFIIGCGEFRSEFSCAASQLKYCLRIADIFNHNTVYVFIPLIIIHMA